MIIEAGGVPVTRLEGNAGHADRPIDEHVGEQRQGPRHGREVRRPEDIRKGDAQELASLEAAQDDGRLATGIQVREAGQPLVEILAGAWRVPSSSGREGVQEGDVLEGEGGEIRTEARQRQQLEEM